MSGEEDEGLLVARVTIENRLTADGESVVWFAAVTPDGDALPLVTTLGLLHLSADTAIRQSMGETE